MKTDDFFGWQCNGSNASGDNYLKYIGFGCPTKVEFVPRQGFKITHRGVSINALASALLKPTLKDYHTLGSIFLNHFRRVNGKSPAAPTNTAPSSVLTEHDFKPFTSEFAYKYFESDLFPFFQKGSFRLGTLRYYREIENLKIADDSEGIASLKIDDPNGGGGYFASYVSGFNYYIFCMSTEEPSQEHRILSENFGGRAMKIRIIPFANALQRRVGALRYSVFEVIYNDSKVFRLDGSDAPGQLFDANNQVIETSYTYILNKLIGIGSYPHLFVKPLRYSSEREVRIAFEMPRDIEAHYLDIEVPELLDYVEFL